MLTYFESVLETCWVEFVESCPVRISYQLLDLWENVSLHIKVQIRLLRINNLGEILEAHLVCVFEFAVILRFVLDGIVRQMNESVANIIEIVLARARPNVSVLIAVAFQRAVNAGHHAINTEVKFALVNKKRIVNILLNYEGSICLCGPTNNVLDLPHILHHLDALPTIRILTRLDYPCVFRCSIFASNGLNLLLFVRFVVTLVVD